MKHVRRFDMTYWWYLGYATGHHQYMIKRTVEAGRDVAHVIRNPLQIKYIDYQLSGIVSRKQDNSVHAANDGLLKR